MRTMVGLLAAALLIAPSIASAADKDKGDKKVPPVLNFKMKTLDGKEVELSKYQGKVVMFVNVATKCGNTPQYKQLEELYEKYGKDGLVIVGVPANEFGMQEPGTDLEIAKFCESTYNVKFPMMSKVVVKGEGICPLYKYLTKDTDPKIAGDVTWNFEKFVVGRNGEVVARFKPKTKPDAEEVIKTIEEELKKK